tara:strand:- start:201 stop:479 length:279 start_codon:yes stop_codon:yes gene_type:complete
MGKNIVTVKGKRYLQTHEFGEGHTELLRLCNWWVEIDDKEQPIGMTFTGGTTPEGLEKAIIAVDGYKEAGFTCVGARFPSKNPQWFDREFKP